jgi:hypothetical protein
MVLRRRIICGSRRVFEGGILRSVRITRCYRDTVRTSSVSTVTLPCKEESLVTRIDISDA